MYYWEPTINKSIKLMWVLSRSEWMEKQNKHFFSYCGKYEFSYETLPFYDLTLSSQVFKHFWRYVLVTVRNIKYKRFLHVLKLITSCSAGKRNAVIFTAYSSFGTSVYHNAGLTECNFRTGELFISSGSRRVLQANPLVTSF